ncbi:MAG: orotate phosphoribosyltransferase [Chloroflexaceae bacterium]|nr:orotate phosphoribosyltransferase [Chloroflexaceae bacterium]
MTDASRLWASAPLQTLKIELLTLLARYAYQEGTFKLSSGQSSDYYLNGKQVTLRGEGALAIARLLLAQLPAGTGAVAGLTLGADPLVSGVSVVSAYENRPLPALIVRKEAKGHGTQAYIEGPTLPPATQVMVLEDVVTTGKSALLAVERLEAAGYRVIGIIALVDREQGGRELYAERGLNFTALFSIGEVQERYRQLNQSGKIVY